MTMYDMTLSILECEAKAEAKGCTVRAPEPNELFVDIDSMSGVEVFYRALAVMRRYIEGDVSSMVVSSPSGKPGHYHAIVTLPRPVKSSLERVCLQACLGSDPMRELLSWVRIDSGAPDECVSVLFEKGPR